MQQSLFPPLSLPLYTPIWFLKFLCISSSSSSSRSVASSCGRRRWRRDGEGNNIPWPLAHWTRCDKHHLGAHSFSHSKKTERDSSVTSSAAPRQKRNHYIVWLTLYFSPLCIPAGPGRQCMGEKRFLLFKVLLFPPDFFFFPLLLPCFSVCLSFFRA